MTKVRESELFWVLAASTPRLTEFILALNFRMYVVLLYRDGASFSTVLSPASSPFPSLKQALKDEIRYGDGELLARPAR